MRNIGVGDNHSYSVSIIERDKDNDDDDENKHEWALPNQFVAETLNIGLGVPLHHFLVFEWIKWVGEIICTGKFSVWSSLKIMQESVARVASAMRVMRMIQRFASPKREAAIGGHFQKGDISRLSSKSHADYALSPIAKLPRTEPICTRNRSHPTGSSVVFRLEPGQIIKILQSISTDKEV